MTLVCHGARRPAPGARRPVPEAALVEGGDPYRLVDVASEEPEVLQVFGEALREGARVWARRWWMRAL